MVSFCFLTSYLTNYPILALGCSFFCLSLAIIFPWCLLTNKHFLSSKQATQPCSIMYPMERILFYRPRMYKTLNTLFISLDGKKKFTVPLFAITWLYLPSIFKLPLQLSMLSKCSLVLLSYLLVASKSKIPTKIFSFDIKCYNCNFKDIFIEIIILWKNNI